MSAKTGIQWTDATWNPVVGCTKVSQGCKNCYAKQLHDQRYKAFLAGKRVAPQYHVPFETVQLKPERLTVPLHWRAPRRVFVNSVSDLFHEDVPESFIAAVFGIMGAVPRHTFQILTKRPDRMRDIMGRLTLSEAFLRAALALPDEGFAEWRKNNVHPSWPLENVWLGVSVENQAAANDRIPKLADTPAAVRFLSCEPLLGPIDFYECGSRGGEDGDPFSFSALRGTDGTDPHIPGIDWVIVGGESGPKARPMGLDWARDIVAAAERANTAVFVKQLGKWITERVESDGAVLPQRWLFQDGAIWYPGVIGAHNWERPEGAIAYGLGDQHGGDMAEWPPDLRIREFPNLLARSPTVAHNDESAS